MIPIIFIAVFVAIIALALFLFLKVNIKDFLAEFGDAFGVVFVAGVAFFIVANFLVAMGSSEIAKGYHETSSKEIDVREIVYVDHNSIEYIADDGTLKNITANEIVINEADAVYLKEVSYANHLWSLFPQKRIYVDVPNIDTVLHIKENAE